MNKSITENKIEMLWFTAGGMWALLTFCYILTIGTL